MRIGLLNMWSGGVAHYRQWVAARALERIGHDVVWFPDPKKRPFEEARLAGPEAMKEFVHMMAKSCDIVHSSYVSLPVMVEMLVAMRHVGNIPIITDIDDDYYNVPEYNAAYRQYQKGTTGGFETIRMSMRVSDAVTVSTEPLYDIVAQDTRKRHWCPNCNDNKAWDDLRRSPIPRSPNEVWLMFLGGMGRIGDLNDIEGPVTEIMERHPNVRLFFVGTIPQWAIKWMPDPANPRNNRAIMTQFSLWHSCAALMTHIKPDIMLAPVLKNDFNKSKSNIKAFEASEAGAAFICTDWDTYSTVPDDACLRVSTNQEWVDGLTELIKSKTLRKQLHSKCLEWTRGDMHIDKHIHKWVELYEEAIERGPVRTYEELREGVPAWQDPQLQQDGQPLSQSLKPS